MKITISPRAEKQLKKASKVNQIILARKIRKLSKQINPPLKGYRNIFRSRVGNYRIVYRKTKREIYLVLIGHRKEVYKILNRLLRK